MGLSARRGRTGRGFKDCKEEFARLWLAGVSTVRIADALGVKSAETLKRWRRTLNLPQRMPGGYGRRDGRE